MIPATSDDAGVEDDGFEALYTKLEAVAASLEEGDLTLEQSVALYEEGMALAERCQAQLADVEQRIEQLRQGRLRAVTVQSDRSPVTTRP